MTVVKEETLGALVQIYSHFRLEAEVRHVRFAARGRGAGWHTREQIDALPLSRVDHKVLALVAKQQPVAGNRSRRGKGAKAS
ncbi:MAG: hypothetical protein WDN72_01865 [Alphaproteobacteria bacterium]